MRDTTAPALQVPGPITVHTKGTEVPASDPAIAHFLAQASATDLVDGSDPVANDAPSAFAVGDRTVTFSAVDAAGNRRMATSTVTVVHDGAFTFDLPPGVVAEAQGADGAVISYTASASYDDHAAAISCAPPSGSVFPLANTKVTCTAEYGTGDNRRSASASFMTTVQDTTAPVLHVPDPVTVHTSGSEVPASNPAIAHFLGQASATDLVDGSDAVTNDAPSVFAVGERVVTFTAVDAAGNQRNATSSVRVVRDGAFTFDLPSSVVAEAQGPAGVAVTYTASATYEGRPAAISCAPPSGSVFPLGATTVSCTAQSDGEESRSATDSFLVTVRDTTPPTLRVPAAITVHTSATEIRASDPAIAHFLGQASATDAVDGSDPVANDAPEVFAVGDRTVTFSAVDAAGNRRMATSSVRVVHDGVFKFDLPPSVGAEAQRPDGAVSTYTADATYDGLPAATGCTPASGAVFPLGQTSVTCTAQYGADENRQSATASFLVTVRDTTAPALQVPAAITVHTNLFATISASNPAIAHFLGRASATDLVDGSVAVASDAPPAFGFGTQVVRFTAVDRAGNSTVSSSLVRVVLDSARLLSKPQPGAVVRAPLHLAWTRIAKATFYNVQLYRGTHKVLSRWPARNGIALLPAGSTAAKRSASRPASTRGTSGPRSARKRMRATARWSARARSRSQRRSSRTIRAPLDFSDAWGRSSVG